MIKIMQEEIVNRIFLKKFAASKKRQLFFYFITYQNYPINAAISGKKNITMIR